MGRLEADGRKGVGTNTYQQTPSVKAGGQRGGKKVLKVRVNALGKGGRVAETRLG